MLAYQLERINWTEQLSSLSGGRLPGLLAMLIVILIGSQLAEFTWVLVEQWVPEADRQQQAAPVAQGGNRNNNRQLVNQIVSRHLFGKAEVATTSVRKVPVNAPTTSLRLTLNGVFAGDKKEDGYAIIREGDKGTQKLYHVGEKVSGATLQQVLPDHVILMRNGQFETLRFPKLKQGGLDVRSGARSTPAPGPAAVGQQRTELLKLVKIVPVNKRGQLTGYRILPVKDRATYNRMGFRPSDLVVAINGISLLNQNNFTKVMQVLASSNQMKLDVMRQGRRHSFNVVMP